MYKLRVHINITANFLSFKIPSQRQDHAIHGAGL